MTNGIITNSGISQELIKYFYSPNLIFKGSNEEFLNLYCFLSRIEPWDNENIPPEITITDKYLKQIHKNILAIKKINTNDICPVIERVDWTSNTVYSQYSSDSSTLFDVGEDLKLQNKFYVRNSYDQIFKCLCNGCSTTSANGVSSIVEPLIDFSYDYTTGYIETADGYKWKYLFSIDAGSKLKFFDDKWIPVPIFSHRKNVTDNAIGAGEISAINVFDGGVGYSVDTGLGVSTTITINGDGTGASAVAVVSGNSVTRVLMTNFGTDYTYATATINANQNYSGNGAIIIPEVSPIGGHGFDLINELGCKTILISCTFNSTENDTLPDNIDYRQIGLLANPVKIIDFANDYSYRLTKDVFVSPGSGEYVQDEFVFQGQDLLNSTFSGRVLTFDATNNIIYLINTVGTINNNDLIVGNDSKTIRVVTALQEELISQFSGNIVYIENRTKIQRSTSGLEQFRLTIKY